MGVPASLPRLRPRHASGRGAAATALFLASVVVWLLVSAPAASAHAVVISSTPADKTRSATPPTSVTITFNESVSTDLGGLTVLDRNSNRIDTGASSQPSPNTLTTSLQPNLPTGTYIANYKVVSADGHPVTGAIVFGVGDAAIDTDTGNLVATTDFKMDLLAKAGQFLMYLGTMLAAGLAFFLTFIHDDGPEKRPLGRGVRIGVLIAVVGMVVALMAQAGLATGNGLFSAFDRATLSGVLHQGLGWQDAALLTGLALVYASADVRHRATSQSLSFYGGLIATSSFVFWGHATESSRPWLSISADVVHVAAGAFWLGGLVGVSTVLVTRSRSFARVTDAELGRAPASTTPTGSAPPFAVVAAEKSGGVLLAETPTTGAPEAGPATQATRIPALDDGGAPDGDGAGDATSSDAPLSGRVDHHDELAATVRIVKRFSGAAAISLTLLSIAGVLLAWNELGSFGGLVTTTYGELLLAKIAVVALIAVVAGYNRFSLLPWLFQAREPDPDLTAEQEDAEHRAGWQSLLTTVRIEAVAIVVVLAITAVLTNTTPGGAVTEPEIFQQSQPFRGGRIDLVIAPNTPGSNSFHLDMLDSQGKATDLGVKVSIELTLPDKGIGPITRDMIKGGTGHFLLERVNDLAVVGTWTVTLVVRVSDFDQERLTFQDAVR